MGFYYPEIQFVLMRGKCIVKVGNRKEVYRSNEMVLTAEYKINLLRPALGDRLRCRATVLKAGKTLIVAESEVYAVREVTG